MSATSVGQIGLDLVVNQNQFNKQMAGVQSLAKKTGKTLVAAFGVKQIVNFSKQCIELSSDLQEVQNVADVAFPNMTAKMDNFARSAAANFGLSEVMAKKYSSLYGTMAKQFGFTEESAYNMGTTLAGLAGDVASFYNMSQDEAYTKLKSVFSGETETLKEIGVVMTQTALDAYALSRGFGKTTKSMNESEKVALRYAYVQEQLSAASGDFLRTSDSWANQTRLLKLNLEQLGTTIGGPLINAFKPLISTLNTAISKFTEFARAVSDSLGQIYGWDSQEGGVSSDLASGATSADNIASGLEGASDSAKKLKQQLRGIDELNLISKDSFSDNTTGVSNAIIKETQESENAWQETSNKMSKRAQKVANDIAKAFEPVEQLFKDISVGDWFAVGEDVSDLTIAITEFVEKAIEKVEWFDVGQKMADFICGIKWGELVWDFGSLADAIGQAFQDTLVGFSINIGEVINEWLGIDTKSDAYKQGVEDAKNFWDGLWEDWSPFNVIKRAFSGEIEGSFSKIGETLFNFDEANTLFEDAKRSFEIAFNEADFAEIGWWILDGICYGIAGALTWLVEPIKDLFTFTCDEICRVFGIQSPAKEMKPLGKNILLGIVDGFSNSFNEMKKKIQSFFSNLKQWWDTNKPNLSGIKLNLKAPKIKIEWETEGFAAQALQKLGLKGFPNFSVSYYANGGFPEDGWFRAKHGEIMGKFDNGKSVVANNMQITEGISSAVFSGSQVLVNIMQQELMETREQNKILLQLLEKESGISSGDIFNSVRRSADEYTRRTGNPAFSY